MLKLFFSSKGDLTAHYQKKCFFSSLSPPSIISFTNHQHHKLYVKKKNKNIFCLVNQTYVLYIHNPWLFKRIEMLWQNCVSFKGCNGLHQFTTLHNVVQMVQVSEPTRLVRMPKKETSESSNLKFEIKKVIFLWLTSLSVRERGSLLFMVRVCWWWWEG